MYYQSPLSKLFKKRLTPEKFWSWFVENSQTLKQQDYIKSVNEITKQLQRVKENLVCGFSMADPPNPWRLEISCGGIRAHAPAVQNIVAAVPPSLVGWKVDAFRQPGIGPFTIDIFDEECNLEDVKFTILDDSDGIIDAEYFVPLPDDAPEDALDQVGFLALDHMLGEYNVMTKLGHVEFRHYSLAPATAQPLSTLAVRMNGK